MIFEKPSIEKPCINRFPRFLFAIVVTSSPLYIIVDKSGVEISGSALNILRYNAEQAEIQKDVMDYNSQVAQSQKIEEANFARIQGSLARASGRQQAIGYLAGAGSSLLTMKQMGMFS